MRAHFPEQRLVIEPSAVAVLHYLEGKNYLIEWLCTAVM